MESGLATKHSGVGSTPIVHAYYLKLLSICQELFLNSDRGEYKYVSIRICTR